MTLIALLHQPYHPILPVLLQHTPTTTSIPPSLMSQTQIPPSSTYMYMYTAITSSSTLNGKGISSGAIPYTSTTSILPSDTNNDSLNDTGTLCSTLPWQSLLEPDFSWVNMALPCYLVHGKAEGLRQKIPDAFFGLCKAQGI